MKLKKLLHKLGDILDPDVAKRKKHRKKLKALLKELKTKERELKKKLKSAKDDYKRERLQKELEIVHSQRIKGVNALRGEDDHDDKVLTQD